MVKNKIRRTFYDFNDIIHYNNTNQTVHCALVFFSFRCYENISSELLIE